VPTVTVANLDLLTYAANPESWRLSPCVTVTKATDATTLSAVTFVTRNRSTAASGRSP